MLVSYSCWGTSLEDTGAEKPNGKVRVGANGGVKALSEDGFIRLGAVHFVQRVASANLFAA